ncbi:MAG: regulatory protein RecX [Nitrospirota bacterium]
MANARGALILKGSPADIKTAALKLLSYRARSRKEMNEKLRRKGFESGQIEHVIRLLESSGLINDRALAADLLRYSVERKSLGTKGIRLFLAKRGIDRELIDNTLSAHSPESEEKSALEFAQKKMKIFERYPPEVVRRRLGGMLQRRGFSSDVTIRTIHSVMKKLKAV